MKEHDYIEHLDGIKAFVFNVKNKGQEICVSGWRGDHYKFKKGQRIVFVQKSGEGSRYRVKEVRRPGDPPDQYFMDCVYDPRTA